MTDRPPLPPFTRESAAQKVQAAEDAWNTRDPHKVALAYSEDSVWRNRDTFVTGRARIVEFLTRKWEREQEYALRKDLWAFDGNRIAVRNHLALFRLSECTLEAGALGTAPGNALGNAQIKRNREKTEEMSALLCTGLPLRPESRRHTLVTRPIRSASDTRPS